MSFFVLILLMFGAVLLSVLINEFFPKISTPLIQIALGLVLSVFFSGEFEFDAEVFFLLFISPILFDDGIQMDKQALFSMFKPILSLAIGLVFITALVLGFFTHLIVPSIPLAAAFAFAAALGPTDAVAVNSLSKRMTLSSRQSNLLQGEWLLNDASGIVSFKFALAAIITGTFSLVDATSSFLISFFGAILLGAVLMFLRSIVIRIVNRMGVEDASFKVLFEILTPFAVFLVAETLHVSGIIAVVTAGIIYSLSGERKRMDNVQANVISSNVWSTLLFALNGFIFVLLGLVFPTAFSSILETDAIGNIELILIIIAITVVLYLIRFVWLMFIKTTEESRPRQKTFDSKSQQEYKEAAGFYWAKKIKSSLTLSLAGAKGAVTFAIVVTVPIMLASAETFPQRGLIIFLASGVIVLTLLVANFVVPLLVPKKPEEEMRKEEVSAIVSIYDICIGKLLDQRTIENRLAINALVAKYRLKRTRVMAEYDFHDESTRLINESIVIWEHQNTYKLIDDGLLRPAFGYLYLSSLIKGWSYANHKNSLKAQFDGLKSWVDHYRKLRKKRKQRKKEGKPIAKLYPKVFGNEKSFFEVRLSQIRLIRTSNREYVIACLELALESVDQLENIEEEDLQRKRRAYESRIAAFTTEPTFILPGRTTPEERERFEINYQEYEALAISIQRAQIHSLLDSGRISDKTARGLREQLSLQELDVN